ASGSTFLEISGKMLGNIDITIPISSEQHIIADFFRNLDDLITLHQRELDRLQKIKKSCLEKMFV
ncbi:MAG: restriction endonuclease subunit S, partial [Lentisphaeria bacterium]|nr:restriction endonuclease subunit S [Lentisphaeria bacterium]